MSPRVFVVTGASRGLGLEFIKQISANKDTTVFAVARNLAKASELKKLESANVILVEADTSIQKDIEAAAKIITQKAGHVDVLINNAGIQLEGLHPIPISKLPTDGYAETFRVNVIGPILTTQAFLPLLKAGKEKKVMMISTGVASIALTSPKTGPGGDFGDFFGLCPAYAVSKAALNMATAKFAREFKDDGFTFLAMNPGWVVTDMGGPNGMLTADVSISRMLAEVDKMNPAEHNGTIGSVDGNVIPN